MSYEVSIVADSVGPNGARVTTFALKYPRFIHAEFLTHRAISRNASSTRAVPVEKMIRWVTDDPAMPVFWGKNRKGMQATEGLDDEDAEECKSRWLVARYDAVMQAKLLASMGAHKQTVGRLLEPFAHINVVATATSWDNFFSLRCHPSAQPEMQVLAYRMARAYRDSEPVELEAGKWHLPFTTPEDRDRLPGDMCLKLSVARCARVSYEMHDGTRPEPMKDVALYDRLMAEGHWSPFEHQGQALPAINGNGHRSGNFTGWHQYRQGVQPAKPEPFDYTRLDAIDGDFSV